MLNITSDTLITYLGGLILFVFVTIFFTRAVFSINTFLKYQKGQVLLLLKIARANGVSESELETVKNLIESDDMAKWKEEESIKGNDKQTK